MSHQIQIDETTRAATQNEIDAINERDEQSKNYDIQAANVATAKQSALEKLETLGLSKAEIAALLGA